MKRDQLMNIIIDIFLGIILHDFKNWNPNTGHFLFNNVKSKH